MKTLFHMLSQLSLFIKRKYIISYRLYNMMFYITAVIIENLIINPHYNDFVLMGFGTDILLPIKSFLSKLYNSVFTNILNPDINIPSEKPEIKSTIDMTTPYKLAEPELLPDLLINLQHDLHTRISLYQAAIEHTTVYSLPDHNTYQAFIDDLITGGGRDRGYWVLYTQIPCKLKLDLNNVITDIITQQINFDNSNNKLTPYMWRMYKEVLYYVSTHNDNYNPDTGEKIV